MAKAEGVVALQWVMEESQSGEQSAMEGDTLHDTVIGGTGAGEE